MLVFSTSFFEVFGIVIATAVSSAALGVLGLVVKRLSLPTGAAPAAPLVAASTAPDESPETTAADDAERVPLLLSDLRGQDDLLDRYYVDLPSLESLAGDLSIDIDPIRIEQSIASTDSSELGAQLSAGLDIPAMGEVKASAGGATRRMNEMTRKMSVERRSTLRDLIVAVCEALNDKDRIAFDPLAFDPPTSAELTMAELVLEMRDTWSLPAPSPETPVSPALSEQDSEASDLANLCA